MTEDNTRWLHAAMDSASIVPTGESEIDGTSWDVVVVGSGIVGLGHAYAAVKRGLRVLVVDRAAGIQGASVRNFGHACVSGQFGEAATYAARARSLWLELASTAGFWARESGAHIAARINAELAVLDEHSRTRDDTTLLTGEEITDRLPLSPDAVVGGCFIGADLQVDPREATPAIARYLASRGVTFAWRTNVARVASGAIQTSRGDVTAREIFVCTGHDIDQIGTGCQASAEVGRCVLDMAMVRIPVTKPLATPLLTGTSMLRYTALAILPGIAEVRAEIQGENPELLDIDANVMATQRPDGLFLLGDTHFTGAAPTPYQAVSWGDALLREFSALFGVARERVVEIERWQGVYAKAAGEFLIDAPQPGVHVAVVTTGIGMSCGLGFADINLERVFG